MASFLKICTLLHRGCILLHPTETCYGLAADATNKTALVKLYRLKKMPKPKPVSIMVPTLQKAFYYGDFSPLARKLAQQFWPGPLTIIVPRKRTLLKFLNPGAKTVGIRIPDHRWTLKLLKKYGHPLVTTSANISGRKECYSVEDFFKQFRSPQNFSGLFIVDAGKIPRRKPSTVISISGLTKRKGDRWNILRRGSLARSIERS